MSEEKLTAIRTQRSGVGITGMRERVRNLRGAMDIQSNAKGTTISVTFPVSPATRSVPDVIGQQVMSAS